MLPAIVAVGIPEFRFKMANLAEAVDCPPSKKSAVELIGVIYPPLATPFPLTRFQ